ncbi:ribosomal protein L27, partial [Hamiltosporidium tvaerminnensis]
MIFKKNMFVVMTRGRFAGCKATVIKADENSDRVVVAGIAKVPKFSDKEEKVLKKRMNVFVKKINKIHLLATRYKGDTGISNINFDGAFESPASKKTAVMQVTKVFETALINKKVPWLFQ